MSDLVDEIPPFHEEQRFVDLDDALDLLDDSPIHPELYNFLKLEFLKLSHTKENLP